MIIGTAGHIDHGKTSLVKAITGVDADRLKEEKARGITIELGFAYWPEADGGVIGFVDVPGHERFVHTMMAGAQGVDLVMLVVAADDGVMPQTREHLEIIQLLGHRRGVVALTKVDAVPPERVLDAEVEIEALLAGSGLEGSPVFPVSSLTGAGLDALKAWLRAEQARMAPVADSRLFRLAVDRCFVLQGSGVVVTGTVLDGRIEVGDAVTVSPSGLTARVRSIHAQNRSTATGRAGDRCALNLAGPDIAKDKIARGDMIVALDAHAPTRRIDAELDIAPGAKKGLVQWMPVRLHHATAEVGAHIVLLEDGHNGPGGRTRAQLVLEKPIAAYAGDRFVLRDPSASITLGGGRFLDLRAPERKRRTAERAAVLAALANEAGVDALAALLEASAVPVDLLAFGRDRGVPADQARALCATLDATLFSVGKQIFALPAPHCAELVSRARDILTAFHAANPDLAGMGLERLRLQAAPRMAAPLFRALLRNWTAEGWLVLDGNWLRLASHAIAISLEEENLWHDIRPLLAGAHRFRPPRVRDIAGLIGADENEVRRLLRRIGRAGTIDEVAQDHFFLRPVVAEMVNLAAELELEASGWFNAARFRDRIEAAGGDAVGRKVAIQILEFFDSHGVTLRRGDNRRMNAHRRDLFGTGGETPDAAQNDIGRESSLVGRPDFKSGWGRETVPGGFDSHSLPPHSGGTGKRANSA